MLLVPFLNHIRRKESVRRNAWANILLSETLPNSNSNTLVPELSRTHSFEREFLTCTKKQVNGSNMEGEFVNLVNTFRKYAVRVLSQPSERTNHIHVFLYSVPLLNRVPNPDGQRLTHGRIPIQQRSDCVRWLGWHPFTVTNEYNLSQQFPPPPNGPGFDITDHIIVRYPEPSAASSGRP